MGGVFCLLGVQHCAGGAVTRCPYLISPRRVHYAIGQISERGGHIKRAIAHHHGDLHAWHAIESSNLVFWWQRSTNAHAHQLALQRADSKPLPTPKPRNWSVRVGIISQHRRNPQNSAVCYQPKSIWGQFSHLQQVPRDESVVLYSFRSFSLHHASNNQPKQTAQADCLTLPHSLLHTQVHPIGRIHNTPKL